MIRKEAADILQLSSSATTHLKNNTIVKKWPLLISNITTEVDLVFLGRDKHTFSVTGANFNQIPFILAQN